MTTDDASGRYCICIEFMGFKGKMGAQGQPCVRSGAATTQGGKLSCGSAQLYFHNG